MNRDAGASGNVFALMFAPDYAELFKVSNVAVGQGYKFLNCQPVCDLYGIPLLSTDQPCLPDETNWTEHFATPLPTTVSINVQHFLFVAFAVFFQIICRSPTFVSAFLLQHYIRRYYLVGICDLLYQNQSQVKIFEI